MLHRSLHLPLAAAVRSLRAISSVPAAGCKYESDGDFSDSPPLADEIFENAQRSGGYTQGDATYLALARAYADHDPPDLPAIGRLLARMRRERPRSFPERVFVPMLRALGASGRPLAAVRLFLRLPTFGCAPSVISFNTSLSALLSQPGDHQNHRLAVPFYSSAIRRHPSIAPNLLTFNLLLKSLCRSGDLLLKGCPPSLPTYNTLLHALCRHGRFSAVVQLLDRMNRVGIVPNEITCGAIEIGRPLDARRVSEQMERKGDLSIQVTAVQA